MAPQRGTFIVIEGSDGSGKGTQYALLVERLKREGYDVEAFDFPRYSEPSSYFVRQYLNGNYGTIEQVGPYTAALFYALDRYEVAPQIRRAIKEGKVVIANRFTASSMAHQGTKFANPQERRGYFIWLDNLESVMLQVPRPDRSVILRVPAETAQKLVDQKTDHSYTPHKRDIHEADLTHLKKSVQIYDELARTFPKDFVSLDCLRDGKLLTPNVISDMVWGVVEPMLPPVERTRQSSAPVVTQTPAAVASKPTDIKQVPQSEPLPILLALKSNIKSSIPDPIRYFTPGNLPPKAHGTYRESIEEILKLHTLITTRLAEHIEQSEGKSLPEAIALARVTTQLVLPMSTLVTHDGKKQPTYATTTFTTDRMKVTPLMQFADKFLSDTHAPLDTTPKLVSVSPRNELELLPNMVYPLTNIPLTSIKEQVAQWPIARKQDIVADYVRDTYHNEESLLSAISYTWDIVGDFSTIDALLKVGATIASQECTPRYGYDIPKIIEAADLSEQFERCFDISLQLHSALIGSNLSLESQYATLLGHRQRSLVTLSAKQLAQVQATKSDTLHKVLERASELHPLLFPDIL